MDEEQFCLRMAIGYKLLDIILKMGEEKEIDQSIKPVVEYIYNNYKNKITVEDLCKHISVSQSTLFRIFKQNGYTPVEFINSMRVKQAENILIVSNDSMEKIAADCGFESQSYFARVFKKQTGVSPWKYRNEHRSVVGKIDHASAVNKM